MRKSGFFRRKRKRKQKEREVGLIDLIQGLDFKIQVGHFDNLKGIPLQIFGSGGGDWL